MNPILQKIIESAVKSIVTAAGTWLAGKGINADISTDMTAMLTAAAGVLVALAPFAHTLIDKWRKSRKAG